MVSHTTTGAWQSFEARMRRRRAERLVRRAEAAVEAGCLEDAHQCLTEARALVPGLPGLEALERRLSEPQPVVERGTTRRFAAAAVLAVAITVVLGGWAVATRARSTVDPMATADRAVTTDPVATRPAAPAAVVPKAQVSPEPLPAPVERFTLETAAAAASPSVRTETSADPASPAASFSPSPVPFAPLPSAESIPLTAAIAESIRLEPPATADRAAETAISRVEPLPARSVSSDPTPAAAAAPEPVTPPSQEPAVRSVLDRYASAFSSLDVEAAQRVWPGVNRGALARAFDGLESQQVSLGTCRIDVAGQTATAQCAGTTSWSPKVGGGGTRTEPRSWIFELARGTSGWEIVSARVQNR